MNYLWFGANCELESAQAVAPLRGHTETAVWRTVWKSVLNVVLYMKELHILAECT